jgi:hypothetical protein
MDSPVVDAVVAVGAVAAVSWADEPLTEEPAKTENTTNPQLVGKTQKELTLILKAVRENAADHPGLTEEAVKAAITEALRKNKAAKAEAAAAPAAPAKEKVKLTKEQMAVKPCRNGKECPNKDNKKMPCSFDHSKEATLPATVTATPASAPAAADPVLTIVRVASKFNREQLTALKSAITELADRADLADLAALAGPHA